MLTRLILGLAVLGVFASSAALAKDSPFPMLSAQGTWESSKGLQVVIQAGKIDHGFVDVYVNVTSCRGEIIGNGAVRHNLARKTLLVEVWDKHHHHFNVRVKAIYNSWSSDPEEYHLKMTVSGEYRPEEMSGETQLYRR